MVNLYLNSNRIEEILLRLQVAESGDSPVGFKLLSDLPRNCRFESLQNKLERKHGLFSDSQVSGWLDSHHLSLTGGHHSVSEAPYSVIIREPNTGSTIMLTPIPALIKVI